MNDLPTLLLLAFGVAGWALSLYFGFFRFKQFVWARNKVSYDLFTRHGQRRQALANRLLRLGAVGREGRGIDAKRRAAAVTYLENLREGQLLTDRRIVNPDQARHWLTLTLNQLGAADPPTRALLASVNAGLAYGYPHLGALLAAAAAPRPDLDRLCQELSISPATE